MKNFLRIFSILFFSLFIAKNSFAELSFEITNQENLKTKILFFGFNQNDPNLKIDADEIFLRIQRNLKITGLFEIIYDNSSPEIIVENNEEKLINDDLSQANRIIPKIPDSFNAENQDEIANLEIKPSLENKMISVEMLPDFAKYNKAGIGAILIAQMNYDLQGNLEIRLRLWDVLDQRQLFGKYYSSSKENYKKLANLISDKIFSSITGEKKGHFNSKILYVSETGSFKNRKKRIAQIDFDGENKKFYTDGRDLVLTPIFSKKSNEIFYLTYRGNYPQIHKMDLYNLQSEKVGGFYATTFAPSVHPQNENIILLSAIFDGNSDIYEMHLDENRALRLTKNSAIDTTASYSQDGEEIVFISDRNGSQQIFIMDNKGTKIKQISNNQGNYSKPIFSPFLPMIAFTLQKNNRFYVGTMSKDGSNERLLTSSYLIEGVKFSPNGRYLIYSKKESPYGEKSIPRLYILDIATGFEYELPITKGEGATDPDWIEID